MSILEEAINPRLNDNLGTMLCYHRKYRLGDKSSVTVEEAQKIERTNTYMGEKCVVLPVYMYDHSGLAFKTTPFSCPWDSGRVGIIYATYSKIREWYGVKMVTNNIRKKVELEFVTEVDEYSNFIG